MILFNGQVRTVGKHYWWMEIDRPIYGNVVAIREKILKEAKKNKKAIVINSPGCQEVVSPDMWIERSKRIEKVFKIPDRPMVLWQGEVKQEDNPKPIDAFMF